MDVELPSEVTHIEVADLYELENHLFHGTSSANLPRLSSSGVLYEPYVTPSVRMAQCFGLATVSFVGGEVCILQVPREEVALRIDSSIYSLLDEWFCSAGDYAQTDEDVTAFSQNPQEAWGLTGEAFFRADGRDPAIARKALRKVLESGKPTPEDSLRLLGSAQVIGDVPISLLEFVQDETKAIQ